MKKAFFVLICTIAIHGYAQHFTQDITVQIYEKYTVSNGILPTVYNFWDTKIEKSHGEQLSFFIILKLDSCVSTKQVKEIKESIDQAFSDFSDNSTIRGIPNCPIYNVFGREAVFSDIQAFINVVDSVKRYYAVQELTINCQEHTLAIQADSVSFHIYSHEGTLLDNKLIKNTSYNKNGVVQSQDEKRENSNVLIVIDSLMNVFWDEHELLKPTNSPIYRFNYVRLNEDIYHDKIKNSLKENKVARTKVIHHIFHFLTRFLGNAHVDFYKKIPINAVNKEDYLSSNRIQELDVTALENYSMYKISASQKRHDNIPFIPFGHWVTIRDGKLCELFFVYESNAYLRDINRPLQRIFGGPLGEKYYHDMSRFFYGFTTALTIQDKDWISEYYDDLAIRSFFPKDSDSEINSRVIAVGKDPIIQGYEYLKNKNYEIYVTLGAKDEQDQRLSAAWVYLDQDKKNSLRVISEDSTLKRQIEKLPAFLLDVNMKQRWITLARNHQTINLDDLATVNFTLLCMNMNKLSEWLEGESFDALTIFTLGSYLQDLWNDMTPAEAAQVGREFSNLNKYLKHNKSLCEKISFKTLDKEIVQKYTDKYQEVVDEICSINRFKEILNDLTRFFRSDLRNEVHNRRFLFNICYLKILYQYTYDKKSKELKMEPNREIQFHKFLTESGTN